MADIHDPLIMAPSGHGTGYQVDSAGHDRLLYREMGKCSFIGENGEKSLFGKELQAVRREHAPTEEVKKIYATADAEKSLTLGPELTEDEHILIEALREIDPIRRRGVIITALDQLNASLQDKEIKRSRNKKKLIQDASKDLSKVVGR